MKKILLLAFLPLLLVTSACDTVLDEVQPRQSVDADLALQTLSGFEALLISVYDHHQEFDRYGQYNMLYPDAMADNIRVTQPNSNRYTFPTGNTRHIEAWADPYRGINEANILIARIGEFQVDGIADLPAIKRRIEGEARFLRALSYFDLQRSFGYEPGREVNGFDLSVVIRTEPTVSQADADFRARNTNREVYALVEQDLIAAAELLEGSGNPKQRATRAAALSLLARAYLYQSKWAEAAETATQALAAANLTLVQDNGNGQYLASWLAVTHPESIFEFQMAQGQNGAATNVNQSLQSLTDGSYNSLAFEAVPTAQLLAAHEEDDARVDLYASATKGGNPVTYIRKYTGTTAQNVDRVPVIRLPELYFIRAEARAREGDAEGARSDLNAVRNARNLDDVAENLAGDNLVGAILAERRVELAFEGHRFWDLKRLGMDIPKPQNNLGVIPYGDFRILAPLPATQVRANPLLIQNPGR